MTRERVHAVEGVVHEASGSTPRAHSGVESLNSRLRCNFFLRRQVGGVELALLRFFLDPRRYVRSQREARVGPSRTELLSGQDCPYWLEMQGWSAILSERTVPHAPSPSPGPSFGDGTLILHRLSRKTGPM